MIVISSADKLIVAGIKAVPHILDLIGNIINILFRTYSRRLGILLYLLTVLIRACHEEDLIAHLLFIARDHVSKHYIIRVTDMRLTRGICYCRSNIKLLFFTHLFFLLRVFSKEIQYRTATQNRADTKAP